MAPTHHPPLHPARKRFTDPFEPLALTSMDVTQLEQLVHVFVHEHINDYERFLREEQGQLDLKRWKFVNQQEHVASYVQRRQEPSKSRRRARQSASNTLGGSASNVSRSNYDGASTPTPPHNSYATTSSSKKDPPVMLAIGSVTASVSDVTYGACSATLDTTRVKSFYVEDNVIDCAVLASLVVPSRADPFRTLLIKWFEVSQPFPIRALVKNRDFVVIEATGFTHLSNGERVGYHLHHSVHFPQTHEVESLVRGNISVCGIFRQATPNLVDMYYKGFFSPSSKLMRAAVVKSAGSLMTCAVRYSHCAQMRKLMWALQRRYKRGLHEITDDMITPEPPERNNRCVTCKKKLSTRGGLRGPAATCKLCFMHVCSTCNMKKTLAYVDESSGRLMQHDLSFCFMCVHEATVKSDPVEVAREELPASTQHNSFKFGLAPLQASYFTISDVSEGRI